MRKRISKQNKQEKANISLRKVLVIAIIFLMLTGMMGVMATNQKLTAVKILLSSGYEMNIMTTNRKVSDILAENHIIVLEGESVTPDINSELSDNKTITITKGTKLAEEEQSYMSAEEILASYTHIVEKVVTQEIEIPFETVTKDISNGGESTQDRVVQVGSNGLKKVTYRIRYQNGNEIEKVELSSEIIKQPVDKIVEVRTKQVTSRGSSNVGGGSKSNNNSSTPTSKVETIWAIVRQEGGGSYESALAVVSSAVNRTRSATWSKYGSTIYEQLTAPNQYCYSIDKHWLKYLGGNVPEYVKQAVSDAMNGKTNHPYTSFRAYSGASASERKNGIKIGGNLYFGN